MNIVDASAGSGIGGSSLARWDTCCAAAGISQAANRIAIGKARAGGRGGDGVFAIETKHAHTRYGYRLPWAEAMRGSGGDGGGARSGRRATGFGGVARGGSDADLVFNKRLGGSNRAMNVVTEGDRQARKYIEIGGADGG